MPKLRLKVTHTHAGVAYPAGHVIDVDEHAARWLIERDIGTPASRDPLPAVPNAPAPSPRTPSQAKTSEE